MAIDTRQKRSSVLEVPGIQHYPVADGGIDSQDRMQVSGLYAGLAPLFDSFFFWRRSGDGSVTWPKTQGAGGAPSTKVVGKNDPWVPVREVRDSA